MQKGPGALTDPPLRDGTLPRMAAADVHTAYPAEVYESYDAFMQQVIRDTYERGAKRPEFVALVLASGEMIPMAWGRVKKAGVRDLALGAAGVVALRFGWAAKAQVVEDQKLRAPELSQDLGVGAIRFRKSKLVEES